MWYRAVARKSFFLLLRAASVEWWEHKPDERIQDGDKRNLALSGPFSVVRGERRWGNNWRDRWDQRFWYLRMQGPIVKGCGRGIRSRD